jgi:LacI family transcriptional regulator
MRVTMKQIAERANVSRGAVSAVLNDISGIRVSAATRARILKIAGELNYRKDFAATALKTGKTGLFGFICGGLRLPFYAELADCLMQQVNSRGDQLVMMQVNWERHNEVECLNRMIDMVDGLFLASNILAEHQVCRNLLKARKMPVVLLNDKDTGISSVSFDYQVGMEKAFQTLVDHGHRSIAFAGHREDVRKSRAYRHCCEQFGTAPIEYLYAESNSVAALVPLGEEIAQNRARQTALISSDSVLNIMIHGMDRQGLDIPEELSLIAFAGNDTPVKLFRPPLTTVVLNCDVMVRHGMDLMAHLQKSAFETALVEHVVIQPELAPRQSIQTIRH